MPQRQRFGFGSAGAAMSDEITQILAEQEVRKQQEFLNSLKLREAGQADERMRLNAEIQREQMGALKEQRDAAAAARRSTIAGNLIENLAPGAELDEAGAATLRDGGMGSLINQTAPKADIDVTAGLGAGSEENPLGLSSGGARVVPGKSLFKGTAKQTKDAQDLARRRAWIAAQPDSPAKRAMMAQLETGDSSLSPTLFEDPNQQVHVVDPTTGKVTSAGTVPRGSRVVTTPRPPTPDRPNAPQIFYGPDGKARAIQFMPDGTSREVPLPAGADTKVAPKTGKTPAELEAEAAARARGTATGKKEAGAGGGLFSTIGSALGVGVGGAAAPAGPAPKVGDTKRFPNGTVGVFDGTGWVKQ